MKSNYGEVLMAKFTPSRNRQTNRRGIAVVELAITLPVFVLILFGTIETTRMIFLQQSLEICAYQGARVALIPSSNPTKVSNACATILSDRNIRSASVTVSPANYETMPYGTLVQVQVTAPCSINSPFSPWFYGGRALTADVTLMKEY